MTFVVRPEAIEELFASAQWYDARQPGLGKEFVDEAQSTLVRIEATPQAFGRYEFYRGSQDIRRAGLVRFPFSVIYLFEPNVIGVLAFAADKRRPLYWRRRLRNFGA